ncbi:MAG: type II toxin-antitoxin system RelE/ParE family toxin [Spirosomataceae bacterium]|jgi:toxin ParE1/3/4
MNFKISKAAENDLEDIWQYTFFNWSADQADYYFNLILDEIEYLSNYPFSGQEFGFVKEGYFRSKVKSHFIFYRINDFENVIEIIRILHQKMDFKSRLDD